MTGKERILATLQHKKHDRVPFIPNIWQWFYHHKYHSTLPPVLKDCQTYIDALRVLGADIIHKLAGLESYRFAIDGYETWFEGSRPRIPAVTERLLFTEGTVFREKWPTPHGIINRSWMYREMDGTAVETEQLLKDFDSDYQAIRYWLQQREIFLDLERFRRGIEEVGDDGLVPVYLSSTPLKSMHWLARQDRASLLIYDYPAQMQELMQIHERQVLAHLENVIDLEDAWLFVIRDNVDSLFYSPTFVRKYCLPTVKKIVDLVHARGKFVFWHACGQLKALAPLIAESGVDTMEGHAAPPLGDWEYIDALKMNDTYLVNGGMFIPYQELSGPNAAQQIDCFVHDLFESLGPLKKRVLFATGCNWSPLAPYENLVAFFEAVCKYGQLS